MEERLNLREFQSRLAERLKSVASGAGEASKLGFIAGGRHWLVALDQVAEVVTVSHLASAPWTQSWFLGVAGVRGSIYGCTDLAAFLGLPPTEHREEIRLLLVNARFGSHAAFRIDQALGLRSISGMRSQVDTNNEAPWMVARYEDNGGVVWQEIAFDRLLEEPRFLQVAA